MKKKQKNNVEQELIKQLDAEIDFLIMELKEINPLQDKDNYIKYGMGTKRLDELISMRGELVKQMTNKSTKKIEWKDVAQVALTGASIAVPTILTVLMRNSEINNERIFGRSVGYKHIGKIPQPNQIRI